MRNCVLVRLELYLVLVIFRWEDAKGAYLKFINKLIMGHTEIFSYTNTHIHPITHNHSL